MSNKSEANGVAAVSNPPRRLKYRRPWAIFLPVAAAFVALNYLVISTETDDTGKYRIVPEYVSEAAAERDVALREGELPEVNYLLDFELHVMGFLFRLGCKCFGSFRGVQMVWVAAWLVHMFELGVCFRTCRACNASAVVTLRYCFCTVMAGFAQLNPLMKAREEYMAATAPADGNTKAEANAKKKE